MALVSFPSSSSAGLDGISPQVSKNLTAKSSGQTRLNFHRALTNCVKVILEGNVLFEFWPYFFGAKLIALKKTEGGLLPNAGGNTFRRLSEKFAGYHVFESRQAGYGSRQVGVGTEKCAELASHVLRCLIEIPQPTENVISKKAFQLKTLSNRKPENSCWRNLLKYTLKFISTHTRRTVSHVFFTMIQ